MNPLENRLVKNAAAQPPGIVIPNYDLIFIIGQGAFGRVYLAREHLTDALRAVKVLSKQDDFLVRRELTGVRKYQCASNQHPNVINVLTVGETSDVFYYVMEIADNNNHTDNSGYEPVTLATWMARNPHSHPRQAVQIIAKLAAAVAQLHSDGLTHNDLKPENIMIVKGEPKIGDVGLIAMRDEPQRIGTPAYMTPDGRADDVFALGVILYELLTRSPAGDFPRIPPELFQKKSRALRSALGLVNRACHPDSRHRFSDAAALADAAREFERGQAAPKRSAWWLAGAAVILLSASLLFSREPDAWNINRIQPGGDVYTRLRISNARIEPAVVPPGGEVIVSFDYVLQTTPGHRIVLGLATRWGHHATIYAGTPPNGLLKSSARVVTKAPDVPEVSYYINAAVAHVLDEAALKASIEKNDAEQCWIGHAITGPR
ncbi:MAG: serine/threonine protein kinase [Phycisphaerales bacterium]|nr:serine/threonine protein kinase [Phycisphaerales bacterium]